MNCPTHDEFPQGSDSAEARLARLIEHAAHLLPAQGPITVFIHHNTLHAFEDLPFDEAVRKGSRIFGCQPYLSEDRYRDELTRGRIRFDELQEVLREDLGKSANEPVLNRTTRFELRMAMLQYPLRFGPTAELLWFLAETNGLRQVREDVSSNIRTRLVAETRRWAMRDLRRHYETNGNGANGSNAVTSRDGFAGLVLRFRDTSAEEWENAEWEEFTLQALWRLCCEGVGRAPHFSPPQPELVRHRDLLLKLSGVDADLLVHDVLIPFCAAFLDQGLAQWQLPRRDEGFFAAFYELYGRGAASSDGWRRGLSDELARSEKNGFNALKSIHESLDVLGVREREWEDYLSATLLALRGWGGMIQQIDNREDRVVHPIPKGSLVEFLAIRLLLDRLALSATAATTIGHHGRLQELRSALRQRLGEDAMPSIEQRSFLVFQLAQVLGWVPEELHNLEDDAWSRILQEIETFSALERRRIFHHAYERRFVTRALDSVILHAWYPTPTPARPRFQAIFCIDEREESIRRHLEETAPEAATFSTAGFFSVPIYYRGAADAHFVPLCPAVMRPRFWVTEHVEGTLEEIHQRRARTRRALGQASHLIHTGSRSFAFGAALSAVVGVLASIPLVARTLFPRFTARIRGIFAKFFQAPPLTRLHLERTGPVPGPDNGCTGLTLLEMTEIAEKMLRDTGLTRNFARLVFTFGHGSTSMNNPHESAYDCGACGGSRGGPNGRAVAQMINDARVRANLFHKGIAIPDETVFVGGMHNTSTEEMTFYDLDRLPETHRAEFDAARALIEQAAQRNAHERCRRFDSAPLTQSFAAARQHVEGRGEDLAQARPELGHATNAICIIGRRERTRGLFLDRRAFLNSYDPNQDDAQASILTRILGAAVPVCGGINLEYYFSRVDNPGFGCGTKLPHNITSLVGVMDGAASDLRTGLPWQMVEIHEPVRLLFIIETRPEIVLGIMDRCPEIGRMFRNGWLHLAVLSPDAPALQIYRDGAFADYFPLTDRLPRAGSSVDWYRGSRDHLYFAAIDPRYSRGDPR